MAAAYVDDAVFIVDLDRFHGPLDLLLHLIREQDLDIFDIPIARITEQFLAAIADVHEVLELDRAGEFLEMAATLIRIKAQMLLPRHTDELEEIEDPRADLVRRLLEYEFFREVANRFETAAVERSRCYGRGLAPAQLRPEAPPPPLELTLDDLLEAAMRVGNRPPPPADHRVTTRAVPLEQKIELILATLRRVARIEFRRLVESVDRLHAVVTLMAGLELARQRVVAMRQREPFAPLWLYRRKRKEPDENASNH